MLHHDVPHGDQQPGFINLCLNMMHQYGRTLLEPLLTLSFCSQGNGDFWKTELQLEPLLTLSFYSQGNGDFWKAEAYLEPLLTPSFYSRGNGDPKKGTTP